MGMFEKLFGRQRRVTEDNATVELPIPRGPALQVGNVQGVGARERQEDSFAVCNASDRSALEREGFFAVVCDGMGGMDSGNEASEAAVEAFLQLFHSLLAEGDIPRQLREGTLAVSDGIFQKEAFAKLELPAWRCYALGAGVGSLAAADNIVKASVAWNSNFYSSKADYRTGGGNGAAMRIQPHIWAATNREHPHSYILDIFSDAIVTHGHARGILGAIFHGICLAMTLVYQKPLSCGQWHNILPFLEDHGKKGRPCPSRPRPVRSSRNTAATWTSSPSTPQVLQLNAIAPSPGR